MIFFRKCLFLNTEIPDINGEHDTEGKINIFELEEDNIIILHEFLGGLSNFMVCRKTLHS